MPWSKRQQLQPLLSSARFPALWLLRCWAKTCRAPGYLYYVVDRWGARFGTKPLYSRIPGGCRLSCDLTDEVQRQIYFFGVYEPIHAYLFYQLLQPNMVVIDAGANVGQYTLLAATKVGRTGAVHSFEPVDTNFRRLSRHVAENEICNAILNRAALWNTDSRVKLGMPEGISGNFGAYSIRAQRSAAAVEAPAVQLDMYVEKMGLTRVDLIKMDIEGAEPYAIEGGQLLPDTYCVSTTPGLSDNIICKHYPGFFRPLHYEEGISSLIDSGFLDAVRLFASRIPARGSN
jgi:FkbM family methyltransferase